MTEYEEPVLSAERPASSVESTGEQEGLLVERCVQLWRDLLRRTDLHADSHFFTEGGKSMLAAQLVTKFNRLYGFKVKLRTIFAAPTPRLFAESALAERGTR